MVTINKIKFFLREGQCFGSVVDSMSSATLVTSAILVASVTIVTSVFSITSETSKDMLLILVVEI
ncbi:hypothetical protein C2G38_2122526 [Gigaspora rosea]|uniref:Uncharacterized protein n=1 Tax=Gigaspora rosea TaxID=44941 RepID=A0A397U0G6_9GLOM|nr:hypothetical protein C2G38_2122526 [Gigaspora rosea]